MTILGYDIDGQPLRAGDRVVCVEVIWSRNKGKEFVVLGVFHDGDIRISGHDSFGLPYGTPAISLRKLPPKQADNETTTWESIEQLTGWVPEGVRV